MTASFREFILDNTRVSHAVLVPEVRLRLADEIMPLWRNLDEATGKTGIDPPFWAFAWVGGQALARYILDHPAEVAGKTVLDIGAGSALCGLAALLAGAASATAADIDPYAVEAARLNAEANDVELVCANVDLLQSPPPRVDVVLAGDIAYEQAMSARILPWLKAARDAGARVLFGDPEREYFPRDQMRMLARYEVRTRRDLEGVELKQASVFTFES
jgi:predicted nicotinamide N-methyase